MKRLFPYPYNEKLIQSTLDFWGPKYAEKEGKQITRADAEEILRTLDGFFSVLLDIDQKQCKRTIETYYQESGIEIIGHLAEDIAMDGFKALRHVEYAIAQLATVPGMRELLRDLARVEKDGNDGERIYLNSLTQLHSVGFSHKELKLQVLAVESKSWAVLSPRRIGDKSCDFKASDGGRGYFFETKDASAETMSQARYGGAIHYTPMGEEEIGPWIIKRCRDAEEKGADYLICRVPVWVQGWEEEEQEFYDKWIRKVFKIKEQPSKHEVIISKPEELSSQFKGVYIIKSFGYLKLGFQ